MGLDELKKVFVETVLPKIKEGWETAKEKLFGENGILDEIKNNPKEFFDAAKLAAKLDFSFPDFDYASPLRSCAHARASTSDFTALCWADV